MSKKRNRTPNATTDEAATARAPDADDLDGDEVPASPADTTKPAGPVGGVAEDFAELDALADSDADPDAELPPAQAPSMFAEFGADVSTATSAPPLAFGETAPADAPPAATDTLMDAVATGEADPAEPGGTPPSLATEPVKASSGKGGKGKKAAATSEILGDPETLCVRSTAATTAGPLLDLAIAALPVYLRQGGSWQQVMAAASQRSTEYMKANGPTPFDVNVDGMGDVTAMLVRGPSAALFEEFTVYHLAPVDGEMPMAAMPGDLPLPPSLRGRQVTGTMRMPATPGMSAVYNLADKGDKVLGPVLDTAMEFLGKHASIVRPVIALLIVGLAGYRHDRAIVRSMGGIDVTHEPTKPPPAP